jgi:hypothetical protein
VSWVVIYFQEIGEFIKSCSIGLQPKQQRHALRLTYCKPMHTSQWGTQSKRLFIVSCMFIIVMRLEVVINVLNGETWDKVTYNFDHCVGPTKFITSPNIIIMF